MYEQCTRGPEKSDSTHALVQRRKGINARTYTRDDYRGRGRRARWGSKSVLLWNDGGQTGRGGGRLEMCKMAQIGRAECEGCRRLCPGIVPPGSLCAPAPSSARLARGRAADCLGNCRVSVASMHRETDARPYLILATKSRNSQYRPADRFAHAATSILEVGVMRNWDCPPVILTSSGGCPRGFPVDRPGLVSNLE